MSGKRVFVVDAGGRGNAIAHAFARSGTVEKVFVSPGNAGSEMIEKCRLAQFQGRQPRSIPELLAYARQEEIDMTFVGPEGYLSDGIVNEFQEAGQRIIGPKREAAVLENSKCTTKDLLKSLGVPVPPCQNFEQADEAREFVRSFCAENPGEGLVIKADGLAAGKGSIVCSGEEEALSTITRIMESPRLFGAAGERIEIEKRLDGRELMFFALSDGKSVLPLESALDYKQAFSAEEAVAVRLFNKLSGNPNLDNQSGQQPQHRWDGRVLASSMA